MGPQRDHVAGLGEPNQVPLLGVLGTAQPAVALVEAPIDPVGVILDALDLVADTRFEPGQPALDPLQPAGVVVECRLDMVELGVDAAQQMEGVVVAMPARAVVQAPAAPRRRGA